MINIAPEFAGCTESFAQPGDYGHQGYVPDPEATDRFIASQALSVLGDSPYFADMIQEKRDAYLWLPLLELLPNWLRGNQGIGDCVSWGWELGVLMYLYGLLKLGLIDMPLVTGATEAIYGGSRVEARGGKRDMGEDGSSGGSAAKWLTKWGYLLRLDYSQETGSPDDDLRVYSAEKAKAWGREGCGGADDQGRRSGSLDRFASRFPITTTAIKTTDQLAAALQNGYPCPTCSGIGFGDRRDKFHVTRNRDGTANRGQSWNHCELWAGVRWVNGRPQFRQVGSWGKFVSGDDPGIGHDAISFCSFWVDERTTQLILDQGDTFAVTGFTGFIPRKLDWTDVRTAANSDRLPSGPSWV